MSRIVNGSSTQPLSGGPPKQIVLLLHGFGSNGANLISFAPQWQPAMPGALFLAPNAPERCMMGEGYQWWGLTGFDPAALAAGAAGAAPAIDAFIDRKLAQYGLADHDLAIVGFSQGTMMALHVGLRRARPVAAILGYSGMLVGAPELSGAPITRPPVLLVHGDADPIVPVSSLHSAKRELEQMGVGVATHVSRGLGHSVDEVGLALGRDFLADAFGQSKSK